ncbi:hypothetical protein P3W55_13720 [Pseudomonas citronellolis]|uniref:DUF1640 domain-containing protein n=1 Tax=Pseudomonas citronellolis TaxID=53408 RepID=A0AAW6P7X6_9PSED|nr:MULTISPECIES: hypothetical protein [Pseudomonas]MDF3842770.1 hypothetical protein [Pseudomonas citronellolis]
MSETIASIESRWNELQKTEAQQRRDKNGGGGNTGGRNPPGDSELEKRVEALEKAIPELREKLVRVETKLDTMEKSMATKDDLKVLRGEISTEMHKSLNDQTWRFIGFAGALAALAFTAAKFVH